MKVYCYPKCTTCQRAIKWLDSKSIEYELINIKENNPDKETLRTLWQKSGLELKKFFNTSGILYREMELSKKLPAMNDEEKLDLLATDGMLVKRPIFITENVVLVGFKESEWEKVI
ncbi:MAG: arsenate reductase family protein [Spirochaetales bacterium]|nr:arsenate reductase family protein [Spirochaetales bacterium]